MGDIFSVVHSSTTNKIFFGSQNTSIQWYDFDDPHIHDINAENHKAPNAARTMGNTINFFEDGEAHDEENRIQAELDAGVVKCVIREKNVRSNAHDGYLYCLLHAKDLPNMEGEVLISGSGDGDVKVS